MMSTAQTATDLLVKKVRVPDFDAFTDLAILVICEFSLHAHVHN